MQAGTLNGKGSNTSFALDKRFEQRFDTGFGQGEMPPVAFCPDIGRQCGPPWPIERFGFQMNLRAEPVSRRRNQPVETDLAFGDDGDPLALSLGVGDDVCGKNDGHAFGCLRADHSFQLRLIKRIEAGKGLVEDNQLWIVDDGPHQLYGLRHAF